ncbi:hypothetical protein N9W28_04060 [Alphaproteobacteria bacterium]|nr:hypothetical protein [Alphaproteobacteria bacterium]
MAVLLDQQKNFTADFGAIFRSSAIFYIPKNVKTTITVSNYWDFKNGTKVGLLFSIRSMDGKIIERRERYFEKGLVINESDWPIENGSVEVEAFGSKNLLIPYAAVMGVYETEKSISMVHSYGRNHNLIEIEDGGSLTVGRESCWTLRCKDSVINEAVFHNGHLAINEQEALFTITNFQGAEKKVRFVIPPLKTFETYIFSVVDILPNYKDFLIGSNGWGTVHFENQTAFTRLLLVWRDQVSKEVQVTHSNFDYSEIETNKIEATKPALMKWPSLLSASEMGKVVVYPKFSKGRYKISSNENIKETNCGLFINVKNIKKLEFVSTDSNLLPSRIVVGFEYKIDDEVLPLECSSGIVHEKMPPKRFHWAVVSKKFKSQLFFNSFEEIYDVPTDLFLVFRLYSSSSTEYSEKRIELESLSNLPDGIFVEDLFNNDPKLDVQHFSYLSMFSSYGGLLMYSSMLKQKSMTIEHSF